MRIRLKTGVVLILLSFVVSMIGAFPMIVNRDNTLMMPSVLISGILFLAGIVSLFRNASGRQQRIPQMNRDQQ